MALYTRVSVALVSSVPVVLTFNLGSLVSLDGNMNVVLEGAVEFFRGEQKQTYDDVFIRGNNGIIRNFV